MRRSERALFVALVLAGGGCATELPGGDLGASAPAPDAGAPLPVASGCAPFHSIGEIDGLSGGVRSLAQGDGGVLFVVDDGRAGDADVPSLALIAPANASLSDCLAGTTLAGGAPTSALDPSTLSPLSGVTADGQSLLFYEDPYGSVGVATQDPNDGLFHAGATLLWTSDRPAYGTAAVVSGGALFAIGCTPARFLDSDCFVATAPVASPDDESAYTYYVGGGRWSPRVDDAWPMTSGPSSFGVAWLAASERWLLAYVSPLGSTLTVRSGLTPEGPWSAPIAIATCALADPDMFCGGVHLHPAIAAPPGEVVLSYAPATLSPDAAARRLAEPDKWWPRFVALALPPLP